MDIPTSVGNHYGSIAITQQWPFNFIELEKRQSPDKVFVFSLASANCSGMKKKKKKRKEEKNKTKNKNKRCHLLAANRGGLRNMAV